MICEQAGTENYGIITKNDAHIPGKQVYKPVLIGGDLYDTTPTECSPARDKAAPDASSGHGPTETRGGRLLPSPVYKLLF